MKRLILFVFALVCALSLMGCSRGEDDGGFYPKDMYRDRRGANLR